MAEASKRTKEKLCEVRSSYVRRKTGKTSMSLDEMSKRAHATTERILPAPKKKPPYEEHL